MKAIIEVIKENKWQTIIISCLLVVLVFSISYAVFFKSGTGTAKSGSIGTLNVTYTDGETLNFVNSMPLLENEVFEYAPSFEFSVKNTGNVVAYAEISLTNIVIDPTLKTEENFRWALYEGETKLSSGTFENVGTTLSLKKNISMAASATKTYNLKVWINDNGGDQNHLLNATMTGKISATVTSSSVATTFDCTETIETYTISESGNYRIEAAGASGTTGNTYGFVGTPPVGGKGATLSSTFPLNSGDELTIVVGCKGSVVQATQTNGTSGAGGGGSFIFKKIDAITNSKYQFQKGDNYYEVLLVAAGGSGSNDASQNSSAVSGANGIGASFIVPTGVAYSTTVTPGTTLDTPSSSTIDGVLSISQFISHDLAGAYIKINDGICKGGFGGGNCVSIGTGKGGGWSVSGNTGNSTTSFSSGTDTSGTTGSRTGNGYVKIYKD